MPIHTRAVAYSYGGKEYEGLLSTTEPTARRPGVLIAHAWAGRTPNENAFAVRLAEAGYVGLALDLYGKGVVGKSTGECQALMTPFVSDRPMLQARLAHCLEVARAQPEIDPTRIVIMGFCFGGLCALDLARTGADIAGAASFHGLFGAPGNTAGKKISAKVIAFHGYDDPMVPPADVIALGKELTEAGADWQIHAYGGVMHAFTNPDANDPAFGTVFDARAAARSWSSFLGFLEECFG